MDWSKQEIDIAKQLQEPTVKAFLNKVFTQLNTNNGEVIASNIVALDDAEYGRLMKVCYLAHKENKAKIDLIAKVSKMKEGGQKVGKVAPR